MAQHYPVLTFLLEMEEFPLRICTGLNRSSSCISLSPDQHSHTVSHPRKCHFGSLGTHQGLSPISCSFKLLDKISAEPGSWLTLSLIAQSDGDSLYPGRLVPTTAAPPLLKQGYCEGCDVNPCVNQTRCSLCLKGGGQSLEFKHDSLSLPEFLIIYPVTLGWGELRACVSCPRSFS